MPTLLAILALAAATAGAAQALAPTSGRVSAKGRLVSYDAPTRTLVLATARGDLHVGLAPDAVVREGVRTIDADRLRQLVGRLAKVRFASVAGRNVARLVTVAPPSRPARSAGGGMLG